MPRPKFALLWIVRDTFVRLFLMCRLQKIGSAFILVFLLFFLAMVFSFLTFSPVLSPFVYPLF